MMISHRQSTILLLLLMLKGLQAVAQEKGILIGRVMREKEPLVGATVTATRLSDSSRAANGISGNNGRFVLVALPLHDSLLITISYRGYTSFKGLVLLTQKESTMQTVQLQPAALDLDTVVVNAERPVVIKGDTVEFRASAIRVPPNSMARDILKRIPGLEIDNSGRLIFNGRPVSKVLVDGKIFFGEDGSVALSNISSEMVDKIQFANDSLANQRSNQLIQSQVLNLKLKAGNKYFGNSSFLGGTDKRYEGSGFGSLMRENNRLSAYAGRNNINKAGSTVSQFTLVSSGSGITENTFTGLEYGYQLNDKKQITGSYQYNHPNTVRELIKERRQNILSGNQLITQSLSEGKYASNNHKANAKLEHSSKSNATTFETMLDGTNSLSSNNNSTITKDGQGNLLNHLENSYRSKEITTNWANSIYYNKNIDSWNILMSLSYSSSNKSSTDYSDGRIVFYKNNLVDSQQLFRQQFQSVNKTNNLAAELGINKKKGKDLTLSLTNVFNVQWNDISRITRNIDSLGALKVDSSYSNQFRSRIFSNTSTFSVMYNKNNFSFVTGIMLLQNNQAQKDLAHSNSISKIEVNLVPSLSLSKIGNRRSYNLNYTANVILPTLDQLQPVQNISNPLYINKGNPTLSRSLAHNIVWTFNNQGAAVIKKAKMRIYNASLTFNTVQNKIIPSVQTDSLGRQTSSFENINGVYTWRSALSSAYMLKRGKNSFRITGHIEINYLRDKLYLDGILNNTDNISMQLIFNFRYQWTDIINTYFRYAPTWSDLKYQQNKALNQQYWIHNAGLELELYLLKRLKLNQSVSFSYNNRLPAGFDKSSLLWNIKGSYLCLKSRKVEITFSAFDILKQFNNLTRTTSGNYIEDSQANNLQQYFLLGFTYHFGAIAKKP
ncbi:outer membrane beta-barrel protein [Pseudoflavitalea sp. X16]|uniref:TonB-dependent receptor n=1 Tax=Paraflavitalea devenefica TaxID=2716334 RepID=UPI001423C56F|nr:TonB-dependent receptor [Paraflavitalea devenefica]NII25834.1 outer membrane beta-barrel protein [Paraflavitalea devenefica]